MAGSISSRGELPAFPEGNDEIISKGPCEKCGSSDAFVTYGDGHGHCFSCGKTTGGDKANRSQQPVRSAPTTVGMGLLDPRDFTGAFAPLAKRKLASATLSRYGYFVGRFKGQLVHVAPYYDMDGQIAGQKLRMPDKTFVVLKAHEGAPSIGDCQLYGRHVFGDKHDRRVVVTEGELDAMSCAQPNDFKFPCVSVTTGAKGAAKCLKKNYLWLDRFQEIILWFDDDEPGQQAVAECAPLFQVGKVKIAKAAK